MSLVPVHGGLDALVDLTVPLSQKNAMLAEAASLPKIAVTDADLSMVYRFADGTLSPLTGPMNEDDYNSVLDNWTISRNGKSYAWSIPMVLPVSDEEAAALAVGKQAALTNSAGDVVAILTIGSVFDWDKARYVKSVYQTDRMDHPGGNIVTSDSRAKLVGGELKVLPQPFDTRFGEWTSTPSQTRAMIAERKWEAALAFQTRNPLHRAHEYALVHGVQELTRQGLYAGAVLNPLVGQLKGDDVDAPTRMTTYANLVKNRLLGTGDSDAELWGKVGYDINDVFTLIGLDIKMFYGGPAEAIMHAIYRQNHGFSHIVIGRKHADAPFADGTAIWGDFDAHEVFDNLAGELATQPMKVGFAAYYPHLGRVDLMGNNKGEKATFIAGKKVRAMLVAGERPPEEIMRPGTADTLVSYYAAKGAQ